MTLINNPPGLGVILTAVVEISSAELKLLHTNGKLLVSGVVGAVIKIISLTLYYDRGTISYTNVGAGNLVANYQNGATLTNATNANANCNVLIQAQDYVQMLHEQDNASIMDATNIVGRNLILYNSGAEVADGNGVVHAKISYYLESSGL